MKGQFYWGEDRRLFEFKIQADPNNYRFQTLRFSDKYGWNLRCKKISNGSQKLDNTYLIYNILSLWRHSDVHGIVLVTAGGSSWTFHRLILLLHRRFTVVLHDLAHHILLIGLYVKFLRETWASASLLVCSFKTLAKHCHQVEIVFLEEDSFSFQLIVNRFFLLVDYLGAHRNLLQ